MSGDQFTGRVVSQRQEGANMGDLVLRLSTIKGKSEGDIDDLVNEIVSTLEGNEHLKGKLQSYSEKVGVRREGDQQRFLSKILLSCVLADVGTQMSPSIRSSNIEKIRSICRRRGLNFDEVVKLTVYADDMLETINSVTHYR